MKLRYRHLWGFNRHAVTETLDLRDRVRVYFVTRLKKKSHSSKNWINMRWLRPLTSGHQNLIRSSQSGLFLQMWRNVLDAFLHLLYFVFISVQKDWKKVRSLQCWPLTRPIKVSLSLSPSWRIWWPLRRTTRKLSHNPSGPGVKMLH